MGVKGVWAELRRRRVVSTAAAYLAFAFVALQLGEILFPAFDLGPDALRGLFAGLLALFPIVVAVSWIYDVSASGFHRTDAEEEGGARRRAMMAAALLSATVLAWVGWTMVQSVETVGAAPARSIAVLPFADLSAGGDQTFLGDGLAEEVLNILAGVDSLQVAARTSSFAFRDADDIRGIAARLNVATVLEGSVRRVDGNVRITAQLIDAATGFHLWSATFDREVHDLFALQDEIAREIGRAVLAELDLGIDVEGRYIASEAAQAAYWQGRAQWSRRDAVGIPGAIELFNRAIEEDSLYAQAYAGLADSWALLPQFVPGVDAVEALERAESLARRAIELDETLAEPHASLGLVLALRQDRISALAELGRAITLSPSYAPALHWRANVLAEMGRLADARSDAARAASVDPLSASIATDHANILLWGGDIEAARDEFERARSLDFGYAPAAFGAALVALEEGEEVGLRMALTQWAATSGLPVRGAMQLAQAMMEYRVTGEPQPVPSTLVQMAQSGRLSAGTIAAIHGLLGDADGALSWLEGAIDDGSWIDQYFRVNLAYDSVRDHPRFEELMATIGA